MKIPVSIASINRAEKVCKNKEAKKFGKASGLVVAGVLAVAYLTPLASGQEACDTRPKPQPITLTDYGYILCNVAFCVWQVTR